MAKAPALVRTLSARATRGHIVLGHLRLACAIGRIGLSAGKREGDGATPLGRFRVEAVYFRPDRLKRPRTGVPVRPLSRQDGWCDSPFDRNYNRFVRHPYPASAERLWRGDHLYDLVCVLAYNTRPRVQGRGSAIFMHVAREGYRPTEGCIALQRSDLMKLLAALGRGGAISTRR